MKIKIIRIITSIFIALVFIVIAIKITYNFREIYYFDINYLKIDEYVDISKEEIKLNYDILIDYLQTSHKEKLSLPSFSMSNEGRIHFEDVKNLLINFNYLLYISLIISIFGSIYLVSKKSYEFIKTSSVTLIVIPLILLFPAALDFDSTFDSFHEIFFRNDYYLFDPNLDPIIKVLPQQFFFHSAIFLLVLIILESLLLYFIYRIILKKKFKK